METVGWACGQGLGSAWMWETQEGKGSSGSIKTFQMVFRAAERSQLT